MRADESGVPKEIRETMEIFSSQIAIALENARLYSKLNEQMTELKRSHALLSRAERFSFSGQPGRKIGPRNQEPHDRHRHIFADIASEIQ